MRSHVDHHCDQHPSAWDCPDAVVIYNDSTSSYGLPIRDGEAASATSYITIRFCPWCGQQLTDLNHDPGDTP